MNNNIYSMVKSGMIMPMHVATGAPGAQPHEQGGKYGQENVRRLGGYGGIFNTLLGVASVYPQVRQIANAYRMTSAASNIARPFITRNNTQSVVVPMHRNQSLSWRPSSTNSQSSGYRRYDYTTNNNQRELKLDDDLHEQYTRGVHNVARKKLNTSRQLLKITDDSDIIVYNPDKS